MKTPPAIAKALLLAAMSALALAACEHVDFAEDEEPNKPTPVAPSKDDSTQLRAYTVVEAQQLYLYSTTDTTITVAGFIVGTCGPLSLRSSAFAPPFSIDSNVLVADSPYENNPQRCLPVQLPNGSEIRSSLNLVGNPDMLGRTIAVKGLLTSYFATAGIKKPEGWNFVEIAQPNDTTKTPVEPTVADTVETIHGGRQLSL